MSQMNIIYIVLNDNSTRFFFKKKLDTCPFVGPLTPMFWTSGEVSSGFLQSQRVGSLICTG